jgi:hypothetical protein
MSLALIPRGLAPHRHGTGGVCPDPACSFYVRIMVSAMKARVNAQPLALRFAPRNSFAGESKAATRLSTKADLDFMATRKSTSLGPRERWGRVWGGQVRTYNGSMWSRAEGE